MTAIDRVQTAWRLAGDELGFKFTAPFVVEHADGKAVFHGYVCDFGGPAGTVFLVCENFRERFDAEIRAAKQRDYLYSLISAQIYDKFDREVFYEVLRDWDWFGEPSKRPAWL